METVAVNKDTCRVCEEDASILYQCCPTELDRLCESCWSRTISSYIDRGQIASILTGKLRCDYCHQPIDRDRLPKDVQSILNGILLTIPKTKTPKSIEEFNYFYNESKELRRCSTNEKFIFLSQRHYNLLGSCLDTYIQSLMKGDSWNYEEMWLPLRDEPTDDHHDQVNIFVSNDFKSNNNGSLLLIQGSGVVRPGQWARSCCINDSLDIGAMFPYMTMAKENNLSVIIFNPNQTSYIEQGTISNEENIEKVDTDADNVETDSSTENRADDDECRSFYLSSNPLPRVPTKKIANLSSNREHILYVYDNIIDKICPAKNLYIVAHSAGGDGLMYLLRKRHEHILPKLKKIAFTDSVHSILPCEANEIKNFIRDHAKHFVASDEPMGTPIDNRYDFSQGSACEEVSAGHYKHEYTSGHCVKGVFEFFFPPTKPNDEAIETTYF